MGEEKDPIATLAHGWRASGIDEGDLVLLHSSAARTLRRLKGQGVNATPDLIVDSFLAAVGPSGTLMLPLFNFDFNDGSPFDMRSTPSQMGAVTEAARLRAGTVRTGHPVYSFAIIGRQARHFEDIVNYSGYGFDSPFGRLHQLGGKIAVLDLPDQHSMTSYHYVEEMEQVPYRYYKQFRGRYTDASGTSSEREFALYVRDIERGVTTDVDRMGEELWRTRLYRGDRPGDDNGLRVIGMADFVEATRTVIRAGRALDYLYSIDAGSVSGG